MLHGYLSCVYTDLVSLSLSVKMTRRGAYNFLKQFSGITSTVLTVQAKERTLGCYQPLTHERITSTVIKKIISQVR